MTACQTSGQSDQCESDLAEAEAELGLPLLMQPSPLRVSTHRMSHFGSRCGSGCFSCLQLPRSLTWMSAQSALVPSGPLDAHALQGESTLIDPTCHAEAMANFSTACIWNSGDNKLTWFNSSLWKRRLASDNNVSDTFEGKRVKEQRGGKQISPSASYRHTQRNT